jgi:inner membrane transporter RhtA
MRAAVDETRTDPPAGAGRRAARRPPRGPLLAPLLVVALAFSFQSGSALATRVIAGVGVLDALWLRTAIAGAVLVALRPRSLRLPPRELRLTVGLLALSLLGMNLSFYGAISVAPLGVVVAIEFVGPLAVAVADSRRAVDLVWVALAGGGIVALAGPSGSIGATGLALALSAGLFWGIYLVLARRAVRTLDPLHATTLMIVGSSIVLTALAAPFAPRLVRHPADVGLGVVVALLSTAVPYFLELVALRLVRAATYGVLLSLEPAVAALTGFVIAGQTLGALDVAAIVTVMAAAAGASWRAVSGRRPPEAADVGAPPL